MEGIYCINIHGKDSFFNFINGVPHIADKSAKKGDYWCETVLTEERLKRARKITEFDILRRLEK